MPNSKLLKLGFYPSVSCTPVARLFKKNLSELFMNHQTTFPVVPYLQL